MRASLKIFALLCFTLMALLLMQKHSLIDFEVLHHAFIENKSMIILTGIAQIFNCFFMTLRYQSLLNIFGIQTSLSRASAATVVSNGIGLWLPGSMAVTEVIRIGLMLGTTPTSKGKREQQNKKEMIIPEGASPTRDSKTKSKLTAVSLLDRLIGLFVMMLFTAGAAGYLLVKFSVTAVSFPLGIALLLIFSLVCICFMVYFFLISDLKFFTRFLKKIEKTLCHPRLGKSLNTLLTGLFGEVFSILESIVMSRNKRRHFVRPFLYSVFCFLLAAGGMYFASHAVSLPVSFQAILAALSILSLASLLPIGIGGLGGMQLIAVIIMSAFQVPAQAAASTQLLQTAVNLLVTSALAIPFALAGLHRITTALRSEKKSFLSKTRNL